jgi:hypothetical protein
VILSFRKILFLKIEYVMGRDKSDLARTGRSRECYAVILDMSNGVVSDIKYQIRVLFHKNA